MEQSVWRRMLGAGGIFFVVFPALFGAWIGVAMWRGSTESNAAAVAFNIVLIPFIAIVLLLVMTRGLYRWQWHIARRRAEGTLRFGDEEPAFGAEPTPPPPMIHWPWSLRARHTLLYLLAMAMLIVAFVPYQHHVSIAHFLHAHSAGRRSAGVLAQILFAFLPMIAMVALAIGLTHRQYRRRDAGLLSVEESLLLQAETIWLTSFGGSVAATVLFCYTFGGMAVSKL